MPDRTAGMAWRCGLPRDACRPRIALCGNDSTAAGAVCGSLTQQQKEEVVMSTLRIESLGSVEVLRAFRALDLAPGDLAAVIVDRSA